jgi:hypothetical protein
VSDPSRLVLLQAFSVESIRKGIVGRREKLVYAFKHFQDVKMLIRKPIKGPKEMA